MKDFFRRFLPRSAEPAKPDPMIQVGIQRVGYDLFLVHPDAPVRGVKLVTLPIALLNRHDLVQEEWGLIQHELRQLPTSLRPRKRKPLKKAESDKVNG